MCMKDVDTLMRETPNGLAFSCRECAGTNSRARSGQLQCRVRRLPFM
jgi:hypothetical protein